MAKEMKNLAKETAIYGLSSIVLVRKSAVKSV